MTRKLAIFDKRDQMALLGACEGDNEFVPVWLMMRCGMHPSDVSAASSKLVWHFRSGLSLEWKRAKNAQPRREMIPRNVALRLDHWMKRGRKLTRQGYFHLVRRVGDRVGHPEYSPLSLRHTFCLNELRRFNDMPKTPPDIFSLVAIKMGCSEKIVKQHYIDLKDWERLGEEDDEPDTREVFDRIEKGPKDVMNARRGVRASHK